MRFKSKLSSTLACLALLVAACGPAGQPAAGGAAGGANNVSVPTPAAAGAAATTPAQPAPTAQPQANAQPGGSQTITVNALQGEPDNIDPNKSSFATESAVISRVFEPLL